MEISKKKLEKSQLELTGELAQDIFESYRAKALAHLGAHVEVDGFRKGHVPEAVLLKHISENMLLEEMAEMAIAEHYPKILEQEKIDAIGRPEVAITKLAKGNPLGFKITTTVLPEIELPDYKKIAKDISKDGIKEVIVTDEEVDQTILQIRRMRAHNDLHAKGDIAHDDHNHEEIKDEDLPPLDDEYAKQLGNFESVAQFKDKLKENILLEKGKESKSTLRLKISEAILENTKADVPEILIESELSKMMFRLQTDVEQAGMTFEDYLKNISKTEDDIKAEWYNDAKKKALLELVLFEISKREEIKLDEQEVEQEVKGVLAYYKGADAVRARAYVEQVLTHEKVFAILEN